MLASQGGNQTFFNRLFPPGKKRDELYFRSVYLWPRKYLRTISVLFSVCANCSKKKKNLGCFLCVMLLKNCPVQVLLIPKKTLEGTTLVTDFHLRQLKNKNSNGTSPSKVIVNGLCGNCAYFQNSWSGMKTSVNISLGISLHTSNHSPISLLFSEITLKYY